MSQPGDDVGRQQSMDAGRANSASVPRKVRQQAPQRTIEEFWASFSTKYPGKVLNILPKNSFAQRKAAREPKGTVYAQGALRSYDDARAECIAAVQQLARECRRVNMRYRDAHFDIEFDLKTRSRRCLDGIMGYDLNDSPRPRAVKRIPEIFKDASFYVNDATAADVRQGKTGDCYFLAAVGALGNKQGLIDRVCVAKDEEVGVYGFLFYRDGEWTHTIIDDKLYLSIPDYDESRAEKSNWSEILNRADAEQEYKEAFQTGSRALYFAQCNDENETWLPLLEKAYAKAHGDYYSIIGGFTGEAIEDLTGGVTTELFASDILNKDKFWDDELKHVGTKFLFGCATGRFDDWQDGISTAWRQGIVSTHAYTILRAATYKDERLVLVRNPWGQAEWSGRWSDGSEQWTAESMQALDHKFGDDGMFWISYKDLLRKYQFFDRTRLFDDAWKITQQWTSVDVRWTADYNDTKFSLTLTEDSPVVIVLSQLDERYFTGLEGQYSFTLHFRVDKDGGDTEVVRSHGNYWMSRSVSTEVDLEAGSYSVLIRIKAERDLRAPRVEDVVRRNCKQNQEKLLQVGLAYDLAHARGDTVETEEAKREKAEAKERAKTKTKKEALKKARKNKYRAWQKETREIERTRREKARLEEHKKQKKAKETEAKAKEAEAASQKKASSTEQPSGDTAPAEVNPNETTATVEDKLPEAAQTSAATEKQMSDAGVQSIPSTGNASTETDSSRPSDEGEWVVESKPQESTPADSSATTENKPQDSTAAKLDAAIKEPLQPEKNLAVPTANVAGNSTTTQTPLSPPASPGLPPSSPAAPPSVAGSARTILTFNSSVDSLLDLEVTPSDFGSDSDKDDDDVLADASPDSDNEEFANDPWNAVCVVGLRVYSQKGEASVVVVRPKNADADEDTPLDVDDPSKGVSEEIPSRMGSQVLPEKRAASAAAPQVLGEDKLLAVIAEK